LRVLTEPSGARVTIPSASAGTAFKDLRIARRRVPEAQLSIEPLR
jgi:hypothetical protein